MVNLDIVYELNTGPRILNTDFTLEVCLFGFVKLPKKDDLD